MTDDSVLFLKQDIGPPDEIFFTRYTLDGNVIAKGTSELVNRTFQSGFLEITTIPPQQSSFSVFLRKLDYIKVEDEEDGAFRTRRRKVVAGTCGIVRNMYNLRNDRLKSLQVTTIPYENLKRLVVPWRVTGIFGKTPPFDCVMAIMDSVHQTHSISTQEPERTLTCNS